MHYTHTCQAIRELSLCANSLRLQSKNACLDYGYTGHVIADMSIHPVVEMKVGKYEETLPSIDDAKCTRCLHLPEVRTGMPQTANHLKATILPRRS
jgi:hypothetical protein